MWFDVESPYEDASKVVEMEGQLVVDGECVSVVVCFDYTDKIYIRRKEAKNTPCVLKGSCAFSPDVLVVKVEKETDSLLNGKYDTITFVRTETEETTSS